MPKWKLSDRAVYPDVEVHKSKNYYVYAFYDKDAVFYVGKGRGKRWKGHFHDASLKHSSYKNNKMCRMFSNNEKVVVKIIAKNLTELEALILESKLIESFGTYRNGGVLTNIYTGDFRKTSNGYQFPKDRKEQMSKTMRGVNSTGNEELVKQAKCLVHYRGMTYEEVSKLDDFVEAGVTHKQVKAWCNKQTFGYVLPHLKSIKEIREEQKEECYNLWEKGFLQKQVSDILGIDHWKVKRLIQQYQKELSKEDNCENS